MSDTWYFAYGSNLSKGRKEERTGLIRCSLRARLKDYRLAFNKKATKGSVYANIVSKAESEVWGVIYLCDPEAMAELDRLEGVMGGHYERVLIAVELDNGTQQSAEVYVAGSKFIGSDEKPSDDYLHYILTGANEHGLPIEYIEKIQKLALGPKG
jgi:gamma-glutamylcyclotransferase